MEGEEIRVQQKEGERTGGMIGDREREIKQMISRKEVRGEGE